MYTHLCVICVQIQLSCRTRRIVQHSRASRMMWMPCGGCGLVGSIAPCEVVEQGLTYQGSWPSHHITLVLVDPFKAYMNPTRLPRSPVPTPSQGPSAGLYRLLRQASKTLKGQPCLACSGLQLRVRLRLQLQLLLLILLLKGGRGGGKRRAQERTFHYSGSRIPYSGGGPQIIPMLGL